MRYTGRMESRIFLFLIIFLAWTGLPAAHAQEAPHVRLRVVPEQASILGGETITLAIEEEIDPGWHTYWRNPGDSGAAPIIRWALPAGFAVSDIDWPVPQTLRAEGLVTYGYTGRAVLLQKLIAPPDLPQGPVRLSMEIEILVCSEICVPEKSRHDITLNETERAPDGRAFIEAASRNLPAPFAGTASFYGEGDDLVLRFSGDLPSALTDKATLYLNEWGLVDNAAVTQTERGAAGLTVRQKRGDRPLRAVDKIKGILAYDGGGLAFTALSGGAAAAPEGNADTPTVAGALLFAFLGGLLLNLMPCVFPVLSLKALKLVRLSDKESATARLHSILYTGGILLSFVLFAVMLMALRAVGAQAGWGFQLQSPPFVLFLTYLMLAIGLNLSGVYEITGRFAGIGGRLAGGEGRIASFFTGILAALVATPCTAPFMGVATAYALTQAVPVTLAIFVALGFGLALPYLLLAFVPALRGLLPRPGVWMETFRHVLALPLYAAAIWLAWVFSQQTTGLSALLCILSVMALIAALTVFFKKRPQAVSRKRRQVLCLVLALLAIAPDFFLVGRERAAPAVAAEGWEPYTESGFAALERGDQALFVNMTAAWCITCKVNEKTALRSASVRALFDQRNIRAIEGDWTSRNPEITAFLGRHGRNGVPLYVYYGPRDQKTGARPAPVILPQLLTPGLIRAAIEDR